MMYALLFALSAMAQDRLLYVNGVQADALRSYEFKTVNVRIDDQGNVWIEAPQYRVEVQSAATTGTTTTTTTGPVVVAPGGKYWLVTEDNQSQSHEIEVLINGVLVQKIRSGDAQLILDIGKYLKVGMNTIVFNALPADQLGGGVLNVYVGTGSNEAGTLKLDNPIVTYARRSTDSATGGSKSYQLEVK